MQVRHAGRQRKLDARIAERLAQPCGRPLAIRGRSGSGKTTLLRNAVGSTCRTTVWLSAFDLVNDLATAIRQDRHTRFCSALIGDSRPLCVEHLEDVRGQPCTRAELQRLLVQAAERRPIVMTLTRSRSDGEVTRWLCSWTDLVSLD
jgi:chromosomal replication initiation ATPase DnaA